MCFEIEKWVLKLRFFVLGLEKWALDFFGPKTWALKLRFFVLRSKKIKK